MANVSVVADTGQGAEQAVETVWIVQKLDWQYNDCWYTPQDDAPIKAFTSQKLAQKYAEELTAYTQGQWAEYPEDTARAWETLTIFSEVSRV